MKITTRRIVRVLPILALGVLAASCNYPLAMTGGYELPPQAEIRINPTSPPFVLPTEDPNATPPAGTEFLTGSQTSGILPPGILPPAPQTDPNADSPILYYAQAGDTLQALAVRFGVNPEDITSPSPIPPVTLINPDQLLIIPDRLEDTTSNIRLLPDSEFVYSPTAIDFSVRDFVAEAGGYLSTYSEYLGSTGDTSGADIVQRVAIENSVNPRLLLALLQYQSNWVYGQSNELNLAEKDYPLGIIDRDRDGLYQQLVLAVSDLSTAYYGWREGSVTEITYLDGSTVRLAPDLNAGTVALHEFFSGLHPGEVARIDMDVAVGFPALYEQMFGDAWARAQTIEPLFPPDISQPYLILPFALGQMWSYSGGPHGAWERDGAKAALDFAPGSTEPGCVKSNKLVLAAAPGYITRSGHGVVVLDLDGDGYEQTGWGMLYLHVSANGGTLPAPAGSWVDQGDHIGFPSCEGGVSTGTHIHVARKYNGEWILADGPIPFTMEGWVAHAGTNPYEGTLTRGENTVVANQLGTFTTRIERDPTPP